MGLEETEGDTETIARAAGFPYFSSRVHVISKYPLLDPPQGDNTRVVFVLVRPGESVLFSVGHALASPYGPYLARDGAPLDAVMAVSQMGALGAAVHHHPLSLTASCSSRRRFVHRLWHF